jgi:hypothetical protein
VSAMDWNDVFTMSPAPTENPVVVYSQ